MNVGELREALCKIPDNAEVIIGGETIDGIKIFKGRIKQGYGTNYFTRHEDGRVTAVTFTRQAENSLGQWDSNLL